MLTSFVTIKLPWLLTCWRVGEVLVSRSSKFKSGDIVNCLGGWCGYAVVEDSTFVERLSPAADIPLKAYLGVLGGTGLTAYFGLIHVGQPKQGDTVVVSAAAGATGSIVCQIAKHVLGCRVVGIAGGPQKCAWLIDTVGIDAAVDYKRGTQADFESDLKKALNGGGVDIFFDSVGGWILDKTLKRINHRARVVLCGAISSYNSKSAVCTPYVFIKVFCVAHAVCQGLAPWAWELLELDHKGALE